MKNLIIGDTSQLSMYFDNTYEKISSRNIDLKRYRNKFYNKVYVTFAEQRTFSNLSFDHFNEINFNYTKKIISYFSNICNTLVYYSTAELGNNYVGEISLDLEFNYKFSPYVESKRKITDGILNSNIENAIIVYPVNFNSIYRKKDFLFHKVYDSILNKKKIEIGNVNINRDIVHAKFIAEQSQLLDSNSLLGSGKFVNVRDFIISLYQYYNLDFEYGVSEKRELIALDTYYVNNNIKCNSLFEDTIKEINEELWKK